jgi:hypothetical protein
MDQPQRDGLFILEHIQFNIQAIMLAKIAWQCEAILRSKIIAIFMFA